MNKYFSKAVIILLFISMVGPSYAQYSHQDTLRGTNTEERSWWDVKHYALTISVDIDNKEIKGTNQITFEVTKPGQKTMQIDLQFPMEIEEVDYADEGSKQLPFKREGNVYWIDFSNNEVSLTKKKEQSIEIHFKGKPRVAVNPPWDGGWIWTHDEKGRPWVTVACQGLGASVWYPCKDYQGDEPENGAGISVSVPDSLVVVANGVSSTPVIKDGRSISTWSVTNPINNYNIVPYIGKYVSWQELYNGKDGPLTCEFWVLDYNLEKAKKHFDRDVKAMLTCFEDWFGPYPFYKDHYKLVDAPHLGMEHQSAVAYGNQYKNGYLGMDLSGSGWGNNWDYIIVHESGHEWFGNNITTADIADMWVHEGFTTYSETLFVECRYGKKAADAYVQGQRHNIENDKPIIGPYGVNQEGSGDMYFKGANMIHTIRQIIDDDSKFKNILRGLNKDFYHQVVTSSQIEKYISEKSGKDLSKVFDQYLRTKNIPILEWKQKGKTISYHWSNTIDGFNMPLKLKNGVWLHPLPNWQDIEATRVGNSIDPDLNFFIKTKKV